MTDDLIAKFEAAAKAAKSLERRPGNDDMLEMYALFKQATAGDVSGDRPGGFDFVGAAKFDAWTGLKGISKDDAMQRYIDKVTALQG